MSRQRQLVVELVPRELLGKNPFPDLFQLPKAICTPWLMTPSTNNSNLLFLSSHLLLLAPTHLSLSYRNTGNYIQLTSIKTALLYKVPFVGSGVRMWISFSGSVFGLSQSGCGMAIRLQLKCRFPFSAPEFNRLFNKKNIRAKGVWPGLGKARV